LVKKPKAEKESTPKTKPLGIRIAKTTSSHTEGKESNMAKIGSFEGVEAFGFKLNVYELKKYYEVHFIFTDESNLELRIDRAINYLGEEGFFKKKKRIKATAVKFNE
jgi:hypothetical protein